MNLKPVTLNRDSLVAALAALAAALLPLAVSQGWMSSTEAESIGGLVATFTGGYHVNNARAASAVDLTRPVPVDAPAEPTPVAADAPAGHGDPAPGDIHWVDKPGAEPAAPAPPVAAS